MKNLENQKRLQITEETQAPLALEFGDIIVYHEMADQTSIKLNLIDQLHSQLNQIEVMTQKRQFLLREIVHLIGE